MVGLWSMGPSPPRLPFQGFDRALDCFPDQPVLAVGDSIDLVERRRHDPAIELVVRPVLWYRGRA